MPVKVPKSVLDGISAVQDSGRTNMLDRNAVVRLCMEFDFHKAALWINENRKEYAEGVFGGFEAIEDEGKGDAP